MVNACGKMNKVNFTYTLNNNILRLARNLVETRENSKIESHLFHHISNLWLTGMKQKKNSKMADFQNRRFSKSPILKNFLWKFNGLVLGLVGLTDGKSINAA